MYHGYLNLKTCEKTFCTERSLSTVFSAIINFSILGVLCRLNRQLALQTTLKEVIFPSLDRSCAKEGKNLVSNKRLSDIQEVDIANVDQAKIKAKNRIEILGMDNLLKVGSLRENNYILPDRGNEYNEDNENNNNEDDEDNSNDSNHDNPDDEFMKTLDYIYRKHTWVHQLKLKMMLIPHSAKVY